MNDASPLFQFCLCLFQRDAGKEKQNDIVAQKETGEATRGFSHSAAKTAVRSAVEQIFFYL
jgi:hypothetical protein